MEDSIKESIIKIEIRANNQILISSSLDKRKTIKALTVKKVMAWLIFLNFTTLGIIKKLFVDWKLEGFFNIVRP